MQCGNNKGNRNNANPPSHPEKVREGMAARFMQAFQGGRQCKVKKKVAVVKEANEDDDNKDDR